MKKTINLIVIIFTVVLCSSWTSNVAKVKAPAKVAQLKGVKPSAKSQYDVTVAFGNGTYYPAKLIVSSSSGYYSTTTAAAHTYNSSISVPAGTYSVRVEVDAPYDTPYHTYNYNFYAGDQHKYGSTAANFENVAINSSINVSVN